MKLWNNLYFDSKTGFLNSPDGDEYNAFTFEMEGNKLLATSDTASKIADIFVNRTPDWKPVVTEEQVGYPGGSYTNRQLEFSFGGKKASVDVALVASQMIRVGFSSGLREIMQQVSGELGV